MAVLAYSTSKGKALQTAVGVDVAVTANVHLDRAIATARLRGAPALSSVVSAFIRAGLVIDARLRAPDSDLPSSVGLGAPSLAPASLTRQLRSAMMTLLRARMLACALGAFAAAGCVRAGPAAPGIGQVPTQSGAGGQRASPDGGGRPSVTRKRVSEKREISTLVADDATICIVSEQRYRETRVGDSVWCAWVSGQ